MHYTTTTCTTAHSQAMRYAWSAGATQECSGPQPPYSTNWAGYGPVAVAGPYYTLNMTCPLAKTLEYTDAVDRAGGNGAAYGVNMFNFPQGHRYSLVIASHGSWQCSVHIGTGPPAITMTIDGVEYRTEQYEWNCHSYAISKFGQEAEWLVVEPFCTPLGGLYIEPPPPPPICKA
jgi:hypothetical protein